MSDRDRATQHPCQEQAVAAAGVLLRRRGKRGWRWLLIKATKHGEWGFPKGHANPGESQEACALRECAEETGIAVMVLEPPALPLEYRLPDGRLKRAIYFTARTCQEDICLSAEHGRATWADAEKVLALIPHRNLRDLFQHHLEALRCR